MDALRTPDDRFSSLEDWPFAPQYLESFPHGMRLHYIDEGPSDAEDVFLCLHGEPTWSYLYRKMIPVFVEAGARVVAPDWFGFGRSDKPKDDAAYTFEFHRETMIHVVEALDLKRITLVVQDWGGILGLTLPATHPDRIARLLIMNTALAIGTTPSKGFLDWRDYMANTPDLDVAKLMGRAINGASEGTLAAYAAPFPGAGYKAGVRRFPAIVPTAPDAPGAAIAREAGKWWSTEWSGKSFMAIGAQDPVLGPPVMKMMRSVIKNCPEPLVLENEGHFVQESGEVVARAALKSFAEAS
ncbi:MAG: haloalkane dehalogenase [Myxococcota bacterium]